MRSPKQPPHVLDDAFGEATDRAERMTKAADDAEARLAKVKAQISALATV